MDIWLFAAAAGAGCVAQQWKNLRKCRRSLSDSSCISPRFLLTESSQSKQVVEGENLLPYDALDEEKLGEELYSKREVFIETSSAEMASSSKTYEDDTVRVEGFGESYVLPDGNFWNGLNKGCRRIGEGIGIEEIGVLSLPPPTREMGLSGGFTRKKRSLMCRRTKVKPLKPLTSLESCVMAQFHNDKGDSDDYNINRFCSPHTPSINPNLVAGGNSVITRTRTDAYGLSSGATGSTVSMDTCSQEKTSKSGVPQLPTIAFKEFRRKSKSQIRTVQGRKLNYSSRRADGKGHRLQGSSDDALVFLLGVSFGIMSSLWANNQEVDKLNGLLKRSESLVQDLQDELEMRDTLTVKELAVEHFESQGTQVAAFNEGLHNACSLEEKQDNCHPEQFNGEAEEESFSKIEAELEAELERLEINMSACRLGEESSGIVELDTRYVPDVADGELKDNFFGEGGDPQPYADLDGSGSSPAYPANYVVSPRELSLRLHEVIQSRLEHRVKELETALEKRQRRDQFMESEQTTYWREFSNSNSGSSSIQASPVLDAVEQQNHVGQSAVMDLPGDTCDPYSNAYGKLTKEELEKQKTPSSSKGIHTQETPNTCDQYTWVYNARLHNSTVRNSFADEKPTLFPPLEKNREDGILSRDFISSGDESEEDGSEEMEKLLIQHIVEKARKGSPVVLNAHKMLFSDDQS